MVLVQSYHLFTASLANYPHDSTAWGAVRRYDCYYSDKGGKFGYGETRPHALNPCWCAANINASCLVNGLVYNGTCPTDGTAKCFGNYDTDKYKIELYLNPYRDCYEGQGRKCTKSQPCTPCDLESLAKWDGDERQTRCTTCSV